MIRPYTNADKEQVVAIMQLNVPRYFDEAEVEDFIQYLDNFRESYFVVELEYKIVGSGGINYFPESGMARISWDIIDPDYQGKGFGKELLQQRISEIKNNQAIHLVQVRTTQLVYGFYEKMGFTLEKTEKDFWAKGFDLYQMILPVHEHTSSGKV